MTIKIDIGFFNKSSVVNALKYSLEYNLKQEYKKEIKNLSNKDVWEFLPKAVHQWLNNLVVQGTAIEAARNAKKLKVKIKATKEELQ